MTKADLLQNMDLENIHSNLFDLPEQIARAVAGVEDVRQKIRELEERIKERELAARDEVAAEADERGKPVYSNDTKREAEARRRLVADRDYGVAKDTLQALKADLTTREIETRLLEMKFSAWRHVARLTAARMLFMSES